MRNIQARITTRRRGSACLNFWFHVFCGLSQQRFSHRPRPFGQKAKLGMPGAQPMQLG